METVAINADNRRSWTIISDDHCPVVRFLTHFVRSCDRREVFRFIGRESKESESRILLTELAKGPWSLLLIDDRGERFEGPEAIPFILKNLPSGRIACVAYLIPGTMWLTRQLYMYISQNRKKIANLNISKSSGDPGKNPA